MSEENDKLDVPRVGDNASEPVEGEVDGKPSEVLNGDEVTKDTTIKEPTEPAGFNAETSFKELQGRYDSLNSSYNELRRTYTQSSQRASTSEKKLDQMMKMLSKATETPIDPQQFIRDVQTHGHKPIVELIQKERQKLEVELEEKYGKSLESLKSENQTTQAHLYKEQMRNDVENFPGFKELEPIMAELVDQPGLPIDPESDIKDQIVALYNLAKSRSADQAIAKAHAEGAREKEAQLAKEAGTAIAGGGKSAGTTEPNWDKMSVEDHKKRLIELGAYFER